jgi:ComF family protein
MCIYSIQLKKARCRLCHASTPASLPLCERCHEALPHLGHACPRCALPLDEHTPPDTLCGECLGDPPPFDRAQVPLRYRPPVADMISRFKYHQGLSDGHLAAQLLARHIKQDCSNVQMLLPMPLHPERLRQRGYNQAAELARVVSRATGIPWDTNLLKRTKIAANQREASKRERLRNVRSAFECDSKNLPSRVAIVDDVITTGATARAAAASVKRAGAEWVEIWAVARTPRPGDP